jgi:hypothetical protein
VLRAIAGYEGATSHYICGATHERRSHDLARLRGLDVGSHGYVHHTYCDFDQNLRNIRRGIDVLKGAGLTPQGFVAPHGRFNRPLLAALSELGATHSSEFGLAYDDWPFFAAGSNVLQVPIHPVCLGIFLEAASPGCAATAAAAAATHFQRAATARWNAAEPMFFYGHPDGRLGRYPHVLRETLAGVAGMPRTWRTTLSEFAAWWRARDRVRWQAVQEGDSIAIRVEGDASPYPLAIECWRGGRVACVGLASPVTQFSPAALSWETRPDWTPLPSKPVRRPGGLKARVLRYIDWEHETPVEDIHARNWRGWVKRSLRRIRDGRGASPREQTV